MIWVCELAEDARKDLREVPKVIQERVARVMMQMATDPFQGNVKALHGKEWRACSAGASATTASSSAPAANKEPSPSSAYSSGPARRTGRFSRT